VSLNNMGLGFLFTAKDLASGVMMKVGANFQHLEGASSSAGKAVGAAMGNFGTGMAVFGVGAGILATGLHAANEFGNFEKGIAGVAAKTRASAEDLKMLRDKAIEAGIATQFSPEEAVEGLTKLATSGMTARQSAAALIPVLDLAASSLGSLGLGESAEAVAGTLHSFGLQADEAAKVTDKLTKITQISHFQANDFAGGLSKSAAAAGVFGQSLDDVLVVMGLLRNRNIDASSASTAYREALRRVASDAGAQKALTQAQVTIFDKQSGKLRPLVNIIQDVADTTRSWTDEKRNALVVDAFGARGLLAFAAVQKAMFTQTKNGVQVTHEGAEAIAAMREEMANAGGSAAEFREKLLDTFEGQKILLRGSMMTLSIVSGEAFAMIFRPIVGAIISIVNGLIAAFQKTPAPVKRFFAALFTGVGVFLTVIGGIIALKAALTLVAAGAAAAGISIGGLFLAMLPAVAILGVVVLTVAAFKQAVEKNLGGLGDFVRRTADQARLAFDALGQIFEQGGFSGKVRDELARAENSGVRNFAIRVFLIVSRIQNFFSGVATGFASAIEAARPTFAAFVAALEKLGAAFGFVGSAIDATGAADEFDRWGVSGRNVGATLGRIAELMVQALTLAVEFAIGATEAWNSLSSSAGELFRAFGEVGSALDKLVAAFQGSDVAEAGSGFRALGDIMVTLAAMFLRSTAAVVLTIAKIVEFVGLLVPNVGAAMQFMSDAWLGMQAVVSGVVLSVIQLISALIDALGPVASALAESLGVKDLLADAQKGITASLEKSIAVNASVAAAAAPPHAPAPTVVPNAPGTSVRMGVTTLEPARATVAAMGAAPKAMDPAAVAAAAAAAATAAAARVPPAMIEATMQVDGEVLGRIAAKAQNGADARGFVPTPVTE
jgi:TP901 family phage tail tape measure protein